MLGGTVPTFGKAMALLMCAGENFFGQLGIGSRARSEKYTPTVFGVSEEGEMLRDVKDVQTGANYTTILTADGRILVCGQLNGIIFPTLSSVEILYPLKCTQLACGRKHILALMEGGFVLSWGIGYFGQLGHGDDNSWDNPKMIHALEPSRLGMRVTQIVCGGSHSGAVTDSGRVFMWGLNKSGQCGVSHRSESVMEPKPLDCSEMAPQQRAQLLVCGRNHSALLTTDSSVYVWGCASFGRLGLSETRRTQPTPVELPFFRNMQVHSLASGDFHMLALGHDCGVYSWGYGAEGQTGMSSLFHLRTPRRLDCFDSLSIVRIACGSSYSMAISRAGYLYAWGYGDDGWLGLAPPASMPLIDPDSVEAGAIITQTHTRAFDSRHNVLIPQRVKLLSQYVVEDVRCGGGHTIFLVRPREGGAETKLDEALHDIAGDDEEFSDASLAALDEDELNSQLISWSRHKKTQFVLSALERGAHVNTRDASGNNPMIVAAQNGHVSLLKILAEKGGDINAVNAKGNTSMHYSVAYGFEAVTSFLVKAGADDTITNSDGYTPFEMRLAMEGEI